MPPHCVLQKPCFHPWGKRPLADASRAHEQTQAEQRQEYQHKQIKESAKKKIKGLIHSALAAAEKKRRWQRNKLADP